MARLGFNVQIGVDLAKFRTDMNKAFTTLHSSVGQMNQSLKGLQNEFKGVTTSIKAVGGAIAAIGIAGFAKEILMAADSFNQLTAKVKISLQSASEFDGVFQKLIASSNRSGASLDAVSQAFVRLRPAAQNLGVSNDQLIRFNETFAKLGALSGATSEEMKNAMVQLSQGLATGVLRGQDLKSVMEQMPGIARIIADSMGIPFEKFKTSADKGLITADKVFKALLEKSAKVDEQFSKLPPSIERAMTRINNSIQVFIGALNKATDATTIVAKTLDNLAGFADQNSAAFADLVGQISRTTVELLKAQPAFWGLGDSLNGLIKIDASKWMIGIASGLDTITTKALQGKNEISRFVESLGINGNPADAAKSYAALNSKYDQKQKDLAAQLAARQQERIRLLLADVIPSGSSSNSGKIRNIIPDIKHKKGKVDPDISKAKTLIEQSATPLEKFKLGVVEADRLLKKHLITMHQYQEIVDKLDVDTSKMIKVDPGMDDLTKSQKARVDFAKTSMYNLHKAVEDNLLKPGELFGKSLMEGFKSDIDQGKVADSIIDSVATSMQAYSKTVAELDRQLNAGNISQEQYSKALQNAKDAGFAPLYPEIRQYQKALADLNSLYQGGVLTTYEYTGALKKLKDDVITPILTPLEKYNEGISRLTALYNAGALGAEQMQRQAQSLADDLIQGSQVFQGLEQFAGQALSNIGDGFLNFAKTGKFAFREMIASMLDDMAKLVIQLGVIQPMMNALFGNQQTGGSGFVGKFFGGLIGHIGGAKATQPLGGSLGSNAPLLPPIKLGFASGGDTPTNQPFWVGENGPELMSANKSYRVFDHQTSMAMAGGGGAVHLNQYFTIQTIDNRDFEDRLSQHAKFIGNVSVQAVQRQENRMGRRGPMDTTRG